MLYLVKYCSPEFGCICLHVYVIITGIMAISNKDDSSFNKGPYQGEEIWMHELFGCFNDFRICLFTFCVPCYTMGRNAEYLGENCLLMGILYGVGCGFALGPLMRWRIREKKNLQGSMLFDVIVHWLFPCCALIQENQELYGVDGSHLGEKIPITVKMDRS